MSGQPHATISARELLDFPSAQSGWLRRRGKVERLLASVAEKIDLKWRHAFVVVVERCLYIFSDENSATPRHASPLSHYNIVCRARELSKRSMPWCFKVLPLEDEGKTHYFACTCQNEMKDWMNILKSEMLKAHKKPEISKSHISSDEDLYVLLEEPIIKKEKIESRPVEELHSDSEYSGNDYESPDEDDPGSEGSYDSDYDAIDNFDQGGLTQRPLPALPPPRTQRSVSEGDSRPKRSVGPKQSINSEKKALTLPASKPRKEQPLPKPPLLKSNSAKVFNPPHPRKTSKPEITHAKPLSKRPPVGPPDDELSEYMYDSSDKEAAAQLLDDKLPGTFLVRKSRKSEDLLVLAVRTAGGVKEYQIYDVDNQKSIDKAMMFNTLDQMLRFYQSTALPTQPIKLRHGFRWKKPRS